MINMPDTAFLDSAIRKRIDSSSLFELGDLQASKNNESFILRLNSIASAHAQQTDRIPISFEDAIYANQKLNHHAELFAFGNWLLLDNRPGLDLARGKQPDWNISLKTLGVAVIEHRFRLKARNTDFAKRKKGEHKLEITKSDLAARWRKIFNEDAKASDFDARLRTLKRILPAYFDYLSRGVTSPGGKIYKKSPELGEVYKAITERMTVEKTLPAVCNKPAKVVPFSFKLGYSTEEQREEYQDSKKASANVLLEYKSVKETISGTDRIKFVPEVDLSKYQIKAVIDRMVILVRTAKPVTSINLGKKLKSQLDQITYVQDRASSNYTDNWHAPRSSSQAKLPRDCFFGILIQEPTPKSVAGFLDLIDDEYGISGSVDLNLLEVAVDFYPRDTTNLLQDREQIVAVIQRHHWLKPSILHNKDPFSPRKMDPRQVFKTKKAETRYFFADSKNLIEQNTESTIQDKDKRRHILDAKEGNELFLNSTVYVGQKRSSHLVSLQHKIADRRNMKTETQKSLPADERRARLELTITGQDALRSSEVSDLNDLGITSFRKITKNYMNFWIGTSAPRQAVFEDAQLQLKNRGIYGLELRNRALEIEERKLAHGSGKPFPNRHSKEGGSLLKWSDMNTKIGRSLDRLSEEWKGFSWPK